MIKRRVLAITAIRSEYFLQRPIFSAIMSRPELELELVVTGAHLSPLHGYTVKTIETDGFPIVEKIETLLYSDHDAARLKGGATQLQLLAHIIDSRRPEWLLASCDREEPMMLALCGTYMNIPVLHYSAGDRVVGNADDMVRHAISRLSHLLLTTNEDARQRLIRSGEQEWRVHNVGHSGLDRIRTAPALRAEELANALGIRSIDQQYLIVIQHPLSSEIDQAGEQMRETLEAVTKLGVQTFISYPNSDAGGQQIIKEIEAYRGYPNVFMFHNIPDIPFVNLLRGATILIGNSSLGVLEAPYLKLPVINVGNRQTGRWHSQNICFVRSNREDIFRQARLILDDQNVRDHFRNCDNHYGDGYTGQRVADLLVRTAINRELMNKDLTF